MTTVALAARAVNHKTKSLSLPNVNFKLAYTIIITVCLLLSFVYVLLINQLTSGAYTIKTYNKELASLSKEKRIMETEFAESGLLDQIHATVRELGFEKTAAVTYVQVFDNSVAKAQ